jgi:hypothetical protein
MHRGKGAVLSGVPLNPGGEQTSGVYLGVLLLLCACNQRQSVSTAVYLLPESIPYTLCSPVDPKPKLAGILLRRLLSDPTLAGVSHIVLDEVSAGGGHLLCCTTKGPSGGGQTAGLHRLHLRCLYCPCCFGRAARVGRVQGTMRGSLQGPWRWARARPPACPALGGRRNPRCLPLGRPP